MSRRCFWIMTLLLGSVWADDAGAEIPFPTDPARWINFQPLSAEALEGKAAVFYFYEEGCPKCRGNWPGLLKVSQKYAGKPVVFIAVNSGNPRAAVEGYLRQENIHWPTIVDTDRSFEKFCNVGEVSLQNIYQAAILRADGEIVRGNATAFEQTVEQALQGAAWKVDPVGMPDELKAAWLQVELSNYPAAGPVITRALTSAKPEIQAAAQKLNQAVQSQIEARSAEAAAHLEQGAKWQAYKVYLQLGEKYRGFKLPERVATDMKTLSTDDEVAIELAAYKTLAGAKKVGSKGSDAAIRRATTMLRRLVAEQPTTEAAQEATALLQQIDAPGQ